MLKVKANVKFIIKAKCVHITVFVLHRLLLFIAVSVLNRIRINLYII